MPFYFLLRRNSMRVCGVELKGNEAIICLVGYQMGAFEVPECRTRQFLVSDSFDTGAIRKFQFTFRKLMEDYGVESVVILKREPKGKFAGSATSFKLEAAIQLTDLEVSIIAPTAVKAQMKLTPPMADVNSLGLKKFQHLAFNAAYAHHNIRLSNR